MRGNGSDSDEVIAR